MTFLKLFCTKFVNFFVGFSFQDVFLLFWYPTVWGIFLYQEIKNNQRIKIQVIKLNTKDQTKV